MFCKHATRRVPQRIVRRSESPTTLWQYAHVQGVRALHYDGRNRLSNFWTPTTLVKPADAQSELHTSSHELLVRAGFVRQAHSGIFHLLPLGLRVQNKLEQLVDKHMTRLGASKVSLFAVLREAVDSIRTIKGRDSEFLRLKDRKGARYLLSPTHEEEITTIVAHAVSSHKHLPLRLYQVSRKYRDEARPRQGLLRGREFLMKDLYTFDVTEAEAIATYEDVRKAYCAFLDELRLPYLVANADSGNMGGTLSHEYHFVSDSGEDNVISCRECGYAINEELFAAPFVAGTSPETKQREDYLVSKDGPQKFYRIVTPLGAGKLNLHLIKRLLSDVDTSVEDATTLWEKSRDGSEACEACSTIYDPRCTPSGGLHQENSSLHGTPVLLTQAQSNDACPSCSQPSLSITSAVEIGHTFHLSTRYSAPLGATVLDANNKQVSVEMGCHGIGISRLIAAASGLLADERGLNWPLAIAPFQAVMTAAPSVDVDDIHSTYDELTAKIAPTLPAMDVVIDDRQLPFGWRLKDADMIGYPFIIVLGRQWKSERKVELQCRRLSYKQDVIFDELPAVLKGLSDKL
ncbi:hypothetical protein AMS68_007785 [Peltaster fructicola]|uniref:proline--tRNA ligase n=1 Tax=Peltaster fructicola TaxID=286661 RepID=A0A6H0Y5Z4_9PEZI|nr:hypothetical protein AMS68_007785 [Peltaster fructicola]